MKRQGLIAITLILAVVGLAYLWKNASPNKDEAKLKELREIVVDLQVFPDFIEDATDETSGATDAGIYKYYCSAATYEEIKDSYSIKLYSRGWRLLTESELQRWFRDVGWKNLVFKNGEFAIAIDYSGSLNRKCKYSISYVWRDGSF